MMMPTATSPKLLLRILAMASLRRGLSQSNRDFEAIVDVNRGMGVKRCNYEYGKALDVKKDATAYSSGNDN